MSSGKDVNGSGVFIEDFSGTGTATVTASIWNSTGAVVVGSSSGNGTLNIQNGATLSSGTDASGNGAYIGSFSGTGTATVNGSTSLV